MERKIITPEQIEVLGCECCKYKHNTHIYCQQELCCILADGDKNMLTVDDTRYIIDNNRKENKQMAGKIEVTKQDMVNHPKHYEGCSLECIDIMLMMFGAKDVATHCMVTAYKYMHRYKLKNGYEDLKKAKWYLEKHLDICDTYDVHLHDRYEEFESVLYREIERMEHGK